MITAEVAVYPLKTQDATAVINNSIDTLSEEEIQYSVNSMNTVINGKLDDVFTNLKKMYNEAEKTGGEVTMVITLTNAAN